MKSLYGMLGKIGPSDAPVLLIGESGTGKELAARTLHALSSRSSKPFVAVNCGAIPETLFESELFGHEKGAFTGAVARRPGYFEIADGGTLFLDELDAMPLSSQAKLLRALEQGAFRRVRGKEVVAVDVRVVAAIGTDAETAVESGVLREDLLYRINVFALRLPPLRERMGDVMRLARHFGRAHAARSAEADDGREIAISPAAERAIRNHPWPGNVRELRNAVERAAILAEDGVIDVDLLPPAVRQGRPTARSAAGLESENERRQSEPGPFSADRALESLVGMSLDEACRHLVLATLEATGFNKTRSAEVLGVSVKTVYNKLKTWSREGDGRAERAERLSSRRRRRLDPRERSGDLVSLAEARRRRTGTGGGERHETKPDGRARARADESEAEPKSAVSADRAEVI